MSDKNFCMSQYASLEDLYKAKAEHYESEYRTLKASQSKVKAEGIRDAVKQVKRPMEGSSMESLCLIDDLLNFAAQLENNKK